MNAPATKERTWLAHTNELPTLPAAAPKPALDYTFNVSGQILTVVTVGARRVMFWKGDDEDGRVINSETYNKTRPHPWAAFASAGDIEAITAWGEAAHHRMLAAIADRLADLSDPAFKESIVADVRRIDDVKGVQL